jgi:hypothetical protein
MYPAFAIFILMHSTFVHLGLYIIKKPRSEGNFLQVFNLIIQLVMTYILLLLTPYVAEAQNADVGSVFMNLTYLLIGVNFSVCAI